MAQSNAIAEAKHRFVDRLAELELVQDILQDMSQGRSVLKPITNFCGVEGIGKTCLLQRLYEEAQDNKVPAALVDFAGLDLKGSLESIVAATTQSILMQVQSGVPGHQLGEIERLLAGFPEDFPGVLRQVLNQIAFDSTLLLLFDTTEKVPDHVMDWLEKEIISPLLQTDKVVVVLAGRKAVSWSTFELKRRARQRLLDPLDSEWVGDQIPSYASLADEITNLTAGHPLANERIAEAIRQIEQERSETLSSDEFEHHRERLLQYLFDRLISNQIMRSEEPIVRQAFKITAVLRHFDINALRYMLERFAPIQFKGKPPSYFLELIGKMVDSGLVSWDPRQKGYALDRSVRRIIFLHKFYKEPKGFVEMNKAAAELYALWIERLPDNRINSIIERMFHRANEMSADCENGDRYTPSEIAFYLKSELQDYLERYYASAEFGLKGLIALREELHADTEFRDLLPLELDILERFVGRFVDNFIEKRVVVEEA